jgi:glycosyltransferase involved in cell wall biosynthesis
MKPKISVIIIAKNEEARIAKCLARVAFADERIVVDNGSSDKTIQIARDHGAILFEAKEKDFASVRELGLRGATGKWVLYIDADEEVSDKLASEIRHVVRTNEPPVYLIKRDTYYLGYHWPHKDKVERLFLRTALKGWHGKLHETPVFAGNTGMLTNPITHRTHRTLEEMLVKTNDWSQIEAKLRLDAHHPRIVWWRFLRVMFTGFTRSYLDDHGWQAGTVGFIESIYQAYSMFITYAKLWELQQKKK